MTRDISVLEDPRSREKKYERRADHRLRGPGTPPHPGGRCPLRPGLRTYCPRRGDIVCVASSVYSKAKGYTRSLADIVPGERAARIAARTKEDPRFIQAVLDTSREVLLEYPFVLCELSCGHVGVRAGVDQSNIGDNRIILLPPDPMAAAADLREGFHTITGKDIRVIVTDTCGRSFWRGQTGHAVGWSGMPAIRDFRGDHDLFGHELKITEEAVVDEVAGFANFVIGESNDAVPVLVLRNCPAWTGHDTLYFSPEEDIMRTVVKDR